MRKTWLVVSFALGAFGSAMGVPPSAADEPDHHAMDGAAAGFPTYSRHDIVRVCLAEYGMENTSTLDCVAADEKYKSALSKKWPEIDDQFKKNCLGRLTSRHLNSYFHLDRCIRSSKREKDNPSPD